MIRLAGKCIPLLLAAARTRSRASLTAASGSPTMSNPGSPLEIYASAVTTLPRMPLMHMVRTLQIISYASSFFFPVYMIFLQNTIPRGKKSRARSKGSAQSVMNWYN